MPETIDVDTSVSAPRGAPHETAPSVVGARVFTDRGIGVLLALGSALALVTTSALAVAWPDGPCVVVQGEVHGALTFPPRGERGFGYDPIFTPEGSALTFGEMDPAAKDAISHRARAFAKLKASLRKAAERSVESLWNTIGQISDTFTPTECANYFAAAGYDAA